jgi:hypothetical protein
VGRGHDGHGADDLSCTVAKVKIDPLAPYATNSRRRGMVLRDTKHGAVAAGWPPARGKSKSGYGYYHEKEFGLAAQWASNPFPIDAATAHYQAKGLEYVPRDLIMMASYGWYIELRWPDGEVILPDRAVNPNAQQILDQVTNTNYSIIYRSPIGWVGLDPGSNGDVLTSAGGEPKWLPLPGSGVTAGATWSLLDQNGHAITSGTTWTHSVNQPTVDVIGLGGYNEIMAVFKNVTCASAQGRSFVLGDTNGASWYQASGDYSTYGADGVLAAQANVGGLSVTSALARSGGIHIQQWNKPILKQTFSFNSFNYGFFNQTVALNALRLRNGGSANWTGGSLYVFGR